MSIRTHGWCWGLFVLLFVLPSQGFAQAAEKAPLRVLFIGNSYTYVNDLPWQVEQLAASFPDRTQVQVDRVIAGGATLEWHWNDGHALDRIRRGGWDYVVLQEQSRRPVRDRVQMYRYARLFDEAIRASGAKTALFLTWSRQTEPEGQADLTAAYTQIAAETGALLVPVGTAWEAVKETHPDINLYHEDGSHPGPVGTYLAVCVFYTALVGESPEGGHAPLYSSQFGTDQEGQRILLKTLPEERAVLLQQVAEEALLENQEKQ